MRDVLRRLEALAPKQWTALGAAYTRLAETRRGSQIVQRNARYSHGAAVTKAIEKAARQSAERIGFQREWFADSYEHRDAMLYVSLAAGCVGAADVAPRWLSVGLLEPLAAAAVPVDDLLPVASPDDEPEPTFESP